MRWGNSSDYILWEPLEKPQFAGWELHIRLSEEGNKRPDAFALHTVLACLGAHEPRFTKKVKHIKLIRSASHNYRRAEVAWFRTQGHYAVDLPWHLNNRITTAEYNRLGPQTQKYFYKDVKLIYGIEDITYVLDRWKFPIHELVIKVKKSYDNFIGHLYGDQIGEFDRLYDWLYSAATRGARKRLGHDLNRWRDFTGIGIRGQWKAACKEICQLPTIDTYTEGIMHDDMYGIQCTEVCLDGIYEQLDLIDKKYKLHNRKRYGYD